jgi:hypothetical protein
MKQEVNLITITWEVHEFDLEIIRTFNRPFDYGIYQIYGNHNAYGKDVLLYIGKAVDRTFAVRLQDGQRNNDGGRVNYDFVESTIVPTHIRLGHISASKSPQDIEKHNLIEYKENWNNNINVAEKILIATHPPALNLQLGNRLKDINFNEHYLILNGGNRGALLPEVSTIRNCYEYYDFFDQHYLRNDE